MLDVHDRVPEATVWLRPREPVSLSDVVAGNPALFVFYLFDWSAT